MSDLTLLTSAMDAIRAENISDAQDHLRQFLRGSGLIETVHGWIEPMGQPTGRRLNLSVGSKVAYVADSYLGEAGCPIGIVIAGPVIVTMQDYQYPGPLPPGYKPGDDDRTGSAWIVFWEGETRVDAIWKDDSYLIEVPYRTEYIPLEARSHKMSNTKAYYIQVLAEDGERFTDDNKVVATVSDLIRATWKQLYESVPHPSMSDAEEARKDDVESQLRCWGVDGWTETARLTFPDGLVWTVTQIDVPTKDGSATASLPDEDIDALVAAAFGDVQWVIDDLRSWDSNPESCEYDASKLENALRVIRARTRGKES